MIRTTFRSAAVAILALGVALPASAAFAQADLFAAPVAAAAPSVVYVDDAPVPPNLQGQFTCTLNESHTHLERRTCGGTHYLVPRVAD